LREGSFVFDLLLLPCTVPHLSLRPSPWVSRGPPVRAGRRIRGAHDRAHGFPPCARRPSDKHILERVESFAIQTDHPVAG